MEYKLQFAVAALALSTEVLVYIALATAVVGNRFDLARMEVLK